MVLSPRPTAPARWSRPPVARSPGSTGTTLRRVVPRTGSAGRRPRVELRAMREICRGLRFPEGPVAMPDGSVLLVEIARGTLTRVEPDGRVEVVAETGGGPNGAAL